MKTIAFLIAQSEQFPDKPAIVSAEKSISFRQLRNRVQSLSSEISQNGVRYGDRVAVVASSPEDFISFYLAASALGLEVVIPYDLRNAATAELVDIISSSSPKLVAVMGGKPELVADLQAQALAEIATVSGKSDDSDTPLMVLAPDPIERHFSIFTSGTTGNPKALLISEDVVVRRTLEVADVMQVDETSNVLVSGPLNSTTGMLLAFVGLATGATLVLPPVAGIKALPSHIESYRLTHVMLQPLFLKQFLDELARDNADISSLRLIAYGAAAMPAAILERGRALLKCRWLQGYGLSETFGPFAWLQEEDHLTSPIGLRVGRPGDTIEVAIFNKEGHQQESGTLGEIRLRGPALMSGYCDFAANATTPMPEWFPTGDVGLVDREGFICLHGRASDAIVTMDGYKIYPSEVEHALYRLLDANEIAVVGQVFDEADGEQPVACVYFPALEVTQAELAERIAGGLKNLLSEEKWPRWLKRFDSPLPKNRNGKIAKRLLAAALTQDEISKIPG